MQSIQHAKRYRGGFTLIELLVVLCILGICGAMTIANVGSRSDLVCAAAARSVMADWSYAQTRAISLRKKIYIQQTGNQFSLLSRDNTLSPLRLLKNPVTHDDYSVAFGIGDTSLSQVALSGWSFETASIIGFDELGSPFTYDAGSNVCLPMTTTGSLSLSSGECKIDITLQPYTGDLSVN